MHNYSCTLQCSAVSSALARTTCPPARGTRTHAPSHDEGPPVLERMAPVPVVSTPNNCLHSPQSLAATSGNSALWILRTRHSQPLPASETRQCAQRHWERAVKKVVRMPVSKVMRQKTRTWAPLQFCCEVLTQRVRREAARYGWRVGFSCTVWLAHPAPGPCLESQPSKNPPYCFDPTCGNVEVDGGLMKLGLCLLDLRCLIP